MLLGNAQGKHQPEGLLGELEDYLLKRLHGEQDIIFSIPEPDQNNRVTEHGKLYNHLPPWRETSLVTVMTRLKTPLERAIQLHLSNDSEGGGDNGDN